MYVVTPYPNLLYAFDLSKPGAPVKWMYNPKPVSSSQGEACCDVVNRGAVVRRRQDHLRDARQQCRCGERGEREGGVADEGRRHQQGRDDDDGAARREGSVLVGNSGGEMGVRGWLKALDVRTGKVMWTRDDHGTGQRRADRPVVQTVLREGQGTDLGVKTWPGDARGRSAAAACGDGSPTIPTLDLVFYGTSNPGPWNPEQRPGDNKWTSTHVRAAARKRARRCGRTR